MTDEHLVRLILDARRAKKRSDKANRHATQAMRDAVLLLHKQGLPLRDIGFLMGFTYQRAGQILKEAKSSKNWKIYDNEIIGLLK